MLTAFNYYEPEEENRVRNEIKDSVLFNRELEIAKRFVEVNNNILPKGAAENAGSREQNIKSCPICKDSGIEFFYGKWGVRYLRCNVCYSVFADVEEKAGQEYKQLPEMIKLRTSEEYQRKASVNRRQMWGELLDWLQFRTYRYLGRNTGLSVIDYGTRYQGLIELLNESGICGRYELKNSILNGEEGTLTSRDELSERADIILCLDYMQQETNPISFMDELKANLKQDGLLFLSTRVGSGFDILTLKGKNNNVFPYEHIMMPSKEGLKILLDSTGFELLEITTPGNFDWNYVKANKDGISEKEYFLRYFMNTAHPNIEAEFQRFLQQSGMSSYAQVVAKLK